MARSKPYNQLTYRGRWNRWHRHPDKWPHPGRRRVEISRLALSPKEREKLEKKACLSCGKSISWYFHGNFCRTCQVKRKVVRNLLPPYCYFCGALTVPETNCKECGTAYSAEKAQAYLHRQGKSYKDHVKENAVREGREPKTALNEVKRARRWY